MSTLKITKKKRTPQPSPKIVEKKTVTKRKRVDKIPDQSEGVLSSKTPNEERRKKRKVTTNQPLENSSEEKETVEPIERIESILSTYSKQVVVEEETEKKSKKIHRRSSPTEKTNKEASVPNKTLQKNTTKWFKKTKLLPNKLGTENTTVTTETRASTTTNNTNVEKPKRKEKGTIILEEDPVLFSSKGKKKNRSNESPKLVHPIDVEISSEDENISDVEEFIDDGTEGAGNGGSYEDEGGSFVRFTPTATESDLLEQAKKGHSQLMQSRALQALGIGDYIHCEDITQDPLTNKNYSDPNKCEKDFFVKTDREKYVESAGKDWINEDFASFFQSSETMVALEEYEECEKALQRKDNEAKTEIHDLPKVSSKYVADFLREPIEELGERPCIAGDQCVSLHLFRFLKNNVSLVPKSAINQMTPNASNGQGGTEPNTNNPSPSWGNTATMHSANLVKTAKRQEGFILREFLLPDQQAEVEMKYQLGIDPKTALEKFERRHCILCNRYLTTIKALRAAAGLSKLPKNTVQDHRNYFNCTGEYDLKSLLKPSDGYCGIIGEFVQFSVNDYRAALVKELKFVPKVLTCGEDPFAPRKSIIRENVGIWVESNCVNALKTHEEDNYPYIKTVTQVTTVYPKVEDLLRTWYPMSSFTFLNNKFDDLWTPGLEVYSNVLEKIYSIIWTDDFEVCRKTIISTVNRLFGWDEDKILTEEDYDYYFPYWSVDKTPLCIKNVTHYLTLLMRVNFALGIRRKELKYLKINSSVGIGAYGMGCFYDFYAYASSNSLDHKYARRKQGNFAFDNETLKKTVTETTTNTDTKDQIDPADVIMASPLLLGATDGIWDIDGDGADIFGCGPTRGRGRGRGLGRKRGRGRGRGRGQTRGRGTSQMANKDEDMEENTAFSPTSQKGTRRRVVSERGTRGEEEDIFSRLLEDVVLSNADLGILGDEIPKANARKASKFSTSFLHIDIDSESNAMLEEEDQEQSTLDILKSPIQSEFFEPTSGSSSPISRIDEETPPIFCDDISEHSEDRLNSSIKRMKKKSFFDENYVPLKSLNRTLTGSSHRLFKLNVFLETHYPTCRGYREAKQKKDFKKCPFKKPCKVKSVPARKCDMDKNYTTVEKTTNEWACSLKESFKIYEDILFNDEIKKDIWDEHYSDDLMSLHSFFQMTESEIDNHPEKRKDYHRQKKMVFETLNSTDNVELLYQLGMGYGTLTNANSEDKPVLYHLKSPEKPANIFGTKKALMMTVLYVVCRCERIAKIVREKYPMSLTHSSKVIEWFGTSTSKSGSFPAFVDKVKVDEQSSHSELPFDRVITRDFDSEQSIAKNTGKLVQKTIQNVYSEQTKDQRTREFYIVLEKYLFLLHGYRMSFMRIMLHYKKLRCITFPYTKETLEPSSDEKLYRDSEVPYYIFFPFADGADEGEEGLMFNTQHALPTINEILRQVEFWSKSSGQESCAIAYAFKKCLTYRSQCRDMAKKTKDTCKNDTTLYSYFKAILYMTMTGGYMRSYPEAFPSGEDDNDDNGKRRDGQDSSSADYSADCAGKFVMSVEESTKEGRFYNYTVRPSFYTCMILVDKIFNHETDRKRALDFIKFQKIFSQQIWRENLIHAVHKQPYLRLTQPYLDWSSFENSTDFATNSYRSNLDDVLLLNRTSGVTKKNKDASNYNDNPALFTEAVIDKLKKNEDGSQLDARLHYERNFDKIKKMSKIYAFTKEIFLNEISSRMTSYQDKIILYEMELKQTIRDLKKSMKLLGLPEENIGGSFGKDITTNTTTTTTTSIVDHSIINWYEGGKTSPSELSPTWDESTGCWTFNIIHESARKDVNNHQKIIKKILLDILDKFEDYDFPSCLMEEPQNTNIFVGHDNMRDYLSSDETLVTSVMISHYVSLKKMELENFKQESTLNESTKNFLWRFAMRHHSKLHLTDDQLKKMLQHCLEPSGLVIYAELKSLYPDKMKPKSINDILEKTELRVFCKLYYMFRMLQYANSIRLVPLDKSTMKKIEIAMIRRRYGILEGIEKLPNSAYDVYVTSCCGRIATDTSPGSYGQSDISYNHALDAYVCNKKPKKKASLFKLNDDWISSQAGGDLEAARSVVSELNIDGMVDGIIYFDEDKEDNSSNREDDGDEEDDEDDSEDESSDLSRERNAKENKKKTKANALKVGIKQEHPADIKNCDEKTKYKIAKREKRKRETTPCLKAKALKINLKGFKMIHKTRGKNLKIYGHCPTCAQFHEINQNSKYGIGGYSCNYCEKTSPENYVLRRCTHCNVLITETQYEYSIRIPMIDVYDAENPIKRLPYCKFHVPRKYDINNNNNNNTTTSTSSGVGNTTSGAPTNNTTSTRSVSIKRKENKNVLIYDTEILPTVFLEEHCERILKKKQSLSNAAAGGFTSFGSGFSFAMKKGGTKRFGNNSSNNNFDGSLFNNTEEKKEGWRESNQRMVKTSFAKEKKQRSQIYSTKEQNSQIRF